MRKVFLIAMAATLVITVGAQNKAKNNSQKQAATTQQISEKGKPESNIELLTAATFKQKVMNYDNGQYDWKYIGTKPCIIDFYADWCRPCRMLSPELEKIAEKYKGKIVVYKIDTEKEKELARLFNISSIPALLFVPSADKKPSMLRGYRDATQLEEEVKTILLAK